MTSNKLKIEDKHLNRLEPAWSIQRHSEVTLRLLVIDDDKEIGDTISFYCEQRKIECQVTADGRQGLEAIRKYDFDLILLDIAMPDFTGLDIIESLKKEELLLKNIVVMTASSDSKTLKELKNSGVKAIFNKPGSLEELTEMIERFRGT